MYTLYFKTIGLRDWEGFYFLVFFAIIILYNICDILYYSTYKYDFDIICNFLKLNKHEEWEFKK